MQAMHVHVPEAWDQKLPSSTDRSLRSDLAQSRVNRSYEHFDDGIFMHKEWLKYIPSDTRDLWKKMGDITRVSIPGVGQNHYR